MVSVKHPQANGMIERGYKKIVDAMSKMSEGSSINLGRNLSTVLWADWSTIRTSTGLTLYYVTCGSEPVLPIELEILTWRILPCNDVHSISDLLAIRARKLQRQNEDLEEYTFYFQRIRCDRKERYDEQHGLRVE